MSKLRFGFFSDFEDPTVLFFGSAKALESLQSILLSLEKTKTIKLENKDDFIPLNEIKLTISLNDSNKGMRIENEQKSVFKWNLSKNDVIKISEKISSVVNSWGPSHDYLDGTFDDVQVVISKDEYPDTFIP